MTIERLRADLQIAAFQTQTRIAKLHEKQAGVIEEVYKRLVRVSRLMDELTSPMQIRRKEGEKEKMQEDVVVAANDFQEYFWENKIYFTEDTCAKLDTLNHKLKQAWLDYGLYPEDEPEKKLRRDALWKAWKTVSEEIPAIRRMIEADFRALLGLRA